MDYTAHGILQARILEWVGIPFSRGSSQQYWDIIHPLKRINCIHREVWPLPQSILKGFHHPEAFLECCYPGTNLPGGSMVKKSPCNAGDMGSIPGLGRFPWRRKCQLTPVCLLDNPKDRGSWQATVQGVPELDMNEQLSTHVRIEVPIYSWAVSPYFPSTFSLISRQTLGYFLSKGICL